MQPLLVIIFIIKIFARTNLFSTIKEKHGQDTLHDVRAYERLCKRYEKANCDLRFLLTCKREKLNPNFARPKLSIKADFKTKQKIGRIVVETEIRNKHNAKKELRNKMKQLFDKIREKIGFISSQAVKYRIKNSVRNEVRKWKTTQEKKLEKLRDNAPQFRRQIPDIQVKNIIHNFSSYVLSQQEEKALARGLDEYIPAKFDQRRIEVEFELFYQNVLPHTRNMTPENKTELKSKFLNTFRNYSSIKEPYKYKEIVKRLADNKDICLLKQDKGKGIVIMDRTKYVEKCEEFLNGRRFDKIEEDPTSSFEKGVQDLLRSMKKRFDPVSYRKIYPTSSRPGLFYGTAKVHKMAEGSRNIDELPVRPIVSSIGTATYATSKYLADLLAPLAKSQYTVDSTKAFIERIRNKSIDDEYDMVSFDVTSLFTNVPLDFTIDIILKKIYREKKIKTKLKKEEMRELLNTCTKDMHFTFNGKIYKQNDGVCMGNPLGPVIANIFMVELECTLVPTLSDVLPEWIRYVDDTFTFVKKGKLDVVLNALNAFHQDIKFTHETETNGCIPFLDVRIQRNTDGGFTTSVYRKKTNSNIYINWNSHAPRTWKIGTLHGLLQRAFTICSNNSEVEKEIDFLKKIFSKTNGYPTKVIESIVLKVRNKNNSPPNMESEENEESESADQE